MAVRQSLAEKYALRSQASANNTWSDSVSQSIQEVPESVPKKTRSARKSLAQMYEQRVSGKTRGSKVPGAFGSPIKRVQASPSMGTELPPQLYKTKPKTFSKSLWHRTEPKDYIVGKRQSTGARVAQMARRISGFLASFRMRKSIKDTDTSSWESASKMTTMNTGAPRKHNLDILASTPKTVRFIQSTPSSEDVDEVDITIRENKHKQEQQRLEDEKRKLQHQLVLEQEIAQKLIEDYERKLYLQSRAYEAKLHTLQEKAEEEEKDRKNIEESGSNSQKNSSIQSASLVEQNRRKSELDERTRTIEEKEALLAARERELLLKVRKLQEERGPQHMEYKLFKSGATPYTLEMTRSDRNTDASPSEPKGAPVAKPKPEGLRSEIAAVCENIQHMMSALADINTVPVQEKQEIIQTLQSWDKQLRDTAVLSQSRKVVKLHQLSSFLAEFESLFEQDSRKALEIYSPDKIRGMRQALEKLKNESVEKLRLKLRHGMRYQRQLVRMKPPALLRSPVQISKYVTALGNRAMAVAHQRALVFLQSEIKQVVRQLDEIGPKVAGAGREG